MQKYSTAIRPITRGHPRTYICVYTYKCANLSLSVSVHIYVSTYTSTCTYKCLQVSLSPMDRHTQRARLADSINSTKKTRVSSSRIHLDAFLLPRALQSSPTRSFYKHIFTHLGNRHARVDASELVDISGQQGGLKSSTCMVGHRLLIEECLYIHIYIWCMYQAYTHRSDTYTDEQWSRLKDVRDR